MRNDSWIGVPPLGRKAPSAVIRAVCRARTTTRSPLSSNVGRGRSSRTVTPASAFQTSRARGVKNCLATRWSSSKLADASRNAATTCCGVCPGTGPRGSTRTCGSSSALNTGAPRSTGPLVGIWAQALRASATPQIAPATAAAVGRLATGHLRRAVTTIGSTSCSMTAARASTRTSGATTYPH